MQIQKSFETKTSGVLYLVPTPIGNLSDMTFRAIETLKSVDLIAAEDTRHTHKLLNHFEIDTKQTSFHEHNWKTKIPYLIDLLTSGQNIAQVSDAGMPSISDPGQELVKMAKEQNIQVVALPGASAGITALIASGLVPQPFTFIGFLADRKVKGQESQLAIYADLPATMIFYESPHRLAKTLKVMQSVFGPDRSAVLARELTKQYETYHSGTLAELTEWYQDNEARGEFVILVAGNTAPLQSEANQSIDEVVDLVNAAIASGEKANVAIKAFAKKYGLDRQELYRQVHQVEGKVHG